jgi:hypothetical protein
VTGRWNKQGERGWSCGRAVARSERPQLVTDPATSSQIPSETATFLSERHSNCTARSLASSMSTKKILSSPSLEVGWHGRVGKRLSASKLQRQGRHGHAPAVARGHVPRARSLARLLRPSRRRLRLLDRPRKRRRRNAASHLPVSLASTSYAPIRTPHIGNKTPPVERMRSLRFHALPSSCLPLPSVPARLRRLIRLSRRKEANASNSLICC